MTDANTAPSPPAAFAPARRGDIVVIQRRSVDYYQNPWRTVERHEVHVGVVTSITRAGVAAKARWLTGYGRESAPHSDDNCGRGPLVLSQTRADVAAVDAALAERKEPWRPFENLAAAKGFLQGFARSTPTPSLPGTGSGAAAAVAGRKPSRVRRA